MRSLDANSDDRPESTDRWGLGSLILFGLASSALLMAISPLFVDSSYSIATETLSRAGGQGVDGAWVQRAGVVVASISVLAMTVSGAKMWGGWARRWMQTYAVALILLVVFPTSPWDGTPFDPGVAELHTGSAVVGGLAFILGIVSISMGRSPGTGLRRVFDWTVVAAVAVIPQLMLMSTVPGIWQRLMVALGYLWLLVEAATMANALRADRFTELERPDVNA
ncbi:MAG: DUF998 domain-containing protein [Acidimicrobiia bacterium]